MYSCTNSGFFLKGAICQADRDCSTFSISCVLGNDKQLSYAAIKQYIKSSIHTGGRFQDMLMKCGAIKYNKAQNLSNATKSMEMFLNRILTLEIDEQKEILNLIGKILERLAKVKLAVDNGIYGNDLLKLRKNFFT